MRVNVYTEELPTAEALPLAEVVTAEYVSSRTGQPMVNYGLRIYLKSHPDLHFIKDRDDDRSAITFWVGSKYSNLSGFIEMIKGVVEVDNLNRFRQIRTEAAELASMKGQ